MEGRSPSKPASGPDEGQGEKTVQQQSFAGYTPELLRQAQIQMLQQMRGHQNRMSSSYLVPPGGQILRPAGNCGTRPTMSTGEMRPVQPGGLASAPAMGRHIGSNRPTMFVPMPTVSKATLPQQTPGLFKLPIGDTRPHVRSPLLGFSNDSAGIPASVITAMISSPPNLPIFSQFATIPPYSPKMDDRGFLESLTRFMHLANCPIKKIPLIRPDKQLPMLKLFQLVTALGGFKRVNEGNRWTAIAVSLEMSPITPETVSSLQRLYASLLYAYEQVYFLKMPLDKVICINIVIEFF